MAKAPIIETKFTKKELADIAILSELQQDLERVKKDEMAMRKKVHKMLKAKSEVKRGTTNFALPDGWSLKLVEKENVKVEESVLPAVQEKMREAGIREDVFKFKPSLVAANYKVLTAEQKKIVNEAVITSPGTPTITLIEPKA